jgi:hypothetical protein
MVYKRACPNGTFEAPLVNGSIGKAAAVPRRVELVNQIGAPTSCSRDALFVSSGVQG